MNQKPAIANVATAFSNKCLKCGSRNFANKETCARCTSNLPMPSTVAKNNPGMRDTSGEIGSLKVGLACILAGVLAVILGVFLFHTKQSPEESTDAITVADASQPATSQAEQPAPNAPAENDPQSQEAAKQVLSEIKGFQGIAESKMDYDEYNQRLNNLKAEVNRTLPAFVRHNPSDETFRQEIASAIREYTAAGDWWKTTIRNSGVFNEADRNDKIQVNWASAKTHIDNADRMLVR